MNNDLAAKLLAAIEADRLVLFCGAGLSMAPPSTIPSACTLSHKCAGEYYRVTGVELPIAVRDNLEQMAEHFKGRNELQSFLIQRLVSWEPFKKNPNSGHQAIADFLASGVIELAVSTNYDVLIELAATVLGEPDFRAIVDETGLNRGDSTHRPLLKLHGCCERSRDHTVWCLSQLSEEPLASRIPLLRDWLRQRLQGSDLLVLGFWSDWSYLNKLLADSVSLAEPRHVILVDPQDDVVLQAKASALWTWAHGPNVQFTHVAESAADFLSDLRSRFTRQFLVQMLDRSLPTFEGFFKRPSPVPASVPEPLAAHDLYDLRRDACGKPMNCIARLKRPDESQALVGTIHLYLRAKGATLGGSKYLLDGRRIRIVQGAGKLLSMVREEFASEPPHPDPATMTVCVAAKDDGGVPANIVRAGTAPGIVRGGTAGEWLTEDQLVAELGGLN